MAEKNRVRTTGVQIFRANMLLRRRFAFRTPETYAYDLPSDYDARRRQIPLFDKPKPKEQK